MLEILQQTKELSRYTFHQRPYFELKTEKILKKDIIWSFFFQILMHHNFRQTNVIQLEFFAPELCWQHYSKIKNYVVIHFIKDPNFESKIFFKN